MFKGKKSDIVLETEMFSLTNMLVKRDFLQPKALLKLQRELSILCIEYLQDLDSRPVH